VIVTHWDGYPKSSFFCGAEDHRREDGREDASTDLSPKETVMFPKQSGIMGLEHA